MSRIQDILSKAERDGTARRTTSLADIGRPAVDDTLPARSFVESPPARPAADEVRAPRPVPVESPRVAPSFDGPRPARIGHHDGPSPAGTAEPAITQAEAASIPLGLAGGSAYPSDAPSRLVGPLDPHLVAALAPQSLAAEQYRSLRTRLKRAESGRSLRAIAITSPNKGDGKSLTAANLALTMAQEFQQRVLLIDCDLRRPSIQNLFGLADGPGIGDVLMNLAELDQALVSLPDYHLTVLPAGLLSGHPAELLGSSTMRRVLDTLRTRFDRILIDVPPVEPLADLHILAPMVDGLLMIIRAGVTPKPAIERALAGLDASKVLGLVLNESGGEGTDGDNYAGYGYIAG